MIYDRNPLRIYIRGEVSSGKTMLAQHLRTVFDAIGVTHHTSDHYLFEWESSFEEDFEHERLETEAWKAEVEIYCINNSGMKDSRHLTVKVENLVWFLLYGKSAKKVSAALSSSTVKIFKKLKIKKYGPRTPGSR